VKFSSARNPIAGFRLHACALRLTQRTVKLLRWRRASLTREAPRSTINHWIEQAEYLLCGFRNLFSDIILRRAHSGRDDRLVDFSNCGFDAADMSCFQRSNRFIGGKIFIEPARKPAADRSI